MGNVVKNIVVLANTYKWFHHAVHQRFSPDSKYHVKAGVELLRLSPSNQRTLTVIERDVTTRYRYVDRMDELRGFPIDGVRIVVPYSRQNEEGFELLDYLSHALKEDVRNNKDYFWYDENSPDGQKQLKLKIFDDLGD